MIDAAAGQKRGVKWAHVLHYIKAHCVVVHPNGDTQKNSQKRNKHQQQYTKNDNDDDSSSSSSSNDDSNEHSPQEERDYHAMILRLDSPLQAHYRPNAALQRELAPTYWSSSNNSVGGESNGTAASNNSSSYSVLRRALPVAPASILRALIHVGPAAATQADPATGRLLLHEACLQFAATDSLHTALTILIAARPASLLHRCTVFGHTPLQCLLAHRVALPHRTPALIAAFCQSLPPEYKALFYCNTGATTSNQHHHHPPLEFPKPGTILPGTHTAVPSNAAIVPDAIHGRLPLHAAAASAHTTSHCEENHAHEYQYSLPLAAWTVLYEANPDAKHAVDRLGHTPLHLYLGAATTPTDSDTPDDDDCSGGGGKKRNHMSSRRTQNQHPKKMPLQTLDPAVVSLLLSSRVARTTDAQLRHVLHWMAVSMGSSICLPQPNNDDKTTPIADCYWTPLVAIVQLLTDAYTGQCSSLDSSGMTPVALLFRTAAQWQHQYYLLSKQQQQQRGGAGATCPRFDPPLALIHKLTLVASSVNSIQHNNITNAPSTVPNSLVQITVTTTGTNNRAAPSSSNLQQQTTQQIVALEDKDGRLPIHGALQVAASTEVISFLVQAYPASLVHSTLTQEISPLHAAFQCPWTASLQTKEAIAVLLHSSYQAGKHGSQIDGRLAMKLEDADGCFPIHYACQHNVSVDVMVLLVNRYPACALLQKPNGDLPIHTLVQSCTKNGQCLLDVALPTIVADDPTHSARIELADKDDKKEHEIILCDARAKLEVLIRPLLSEPKQLLIADSGTGLLPLHIAVVFEAATYAILLRMLELSPISAIQYTGNLRKTFSKSRSPSMISSSYSALDLHDMCRNRSLPFNSHDDWHRIRELLFSFGPMLDSHRHREELLSRCVQIVIEELNGLWGVEIENECIGFHLMASREKDGNPPDLELTHTVSAMEAEMGLLSRRRRRRRKNVSKRLAPNKSRHGLSPRSQGSSVLEPSSTRRMPKGLKLQINSSLYDDDDVRLDYDAPSFKEGTDIADEEDFDDDDEGSESESSMESENCSGADSAFTSADRNTDGNDTFGDETGTGGSQSMYNTTMSGSRLQTTFEDGSDDSGTDDSGTYNDESTQRSHFHKGYSQDNTASRDSRRTRRRRGHLGNNAKNLSNRVTFEDDSTLASRPRHSFDDDSVSQSAGSIFEEAKQRLVDEDEKKDDGGLLQRNHSTRQLTPRTANRAPTTLTYTRPYYMSEVGMRLWTFFAMYCDSQNPADNYVVQLAEIIGHIRHDTLDALVSIPLPPYVANYMGKGEDTKGLCFRDVASPKCRALIQQTSFFLGKYDFGSTSDILVHRSRNKESIVVAANEWLFVTEKETGAGAVGVSEENIWATGEPLAEIGVTFQKWKRPVWIQFSKDAEWYTREVEIRKRLGVPVESDDQTLSVHGFARLLAHYSALSEERQVDRTYMNDSADERFNSLNLLANTAESKTMQILLHEYPFAIVYIAPLHSTLHSAILQHGMYSVAECRNITHQMANVMKTMHARDIFNGNVSTRNIVSKKEESSCQWELLNLAYAVAGSEGHAYLGGIDNQGRAKFETGSFPPEMFTKLSIQGLQQYYSYWAYVEKKFNLSIDKVVIDPVFDLATGEAYVVKCHFTTLTTTPADVSLPYDLVSANACTDVWALGNLLYTILTGCTPYHISIRDGRLLDYESVTRWDARSMILDRVHDFLAQDILLKMLSEESLRKKVDVDTLLLHPFFGHENTDDSKVAKIIEERKSYLAAHKRLMDKKFHSLSEKEWLDQRTLTLNCWDFDVLERFFYSPSQRIQHMIFRKSDSCFPCSLILLPFHFSALASKIDCVEQLGKEFLRLSKTCWFSRHIKEAIQSNKSAMTHKISLSELVVMSKLPTIDFDDIITEMATWIAQHQEVFRRDPMIATDKFLQQQILQVFKLFDGRDLFLYLVDEWSCRTIDTFFFIETSSRQQVLESGLLFMYVCLLQARSFAKNLDRLAELLFQTANATVPQSWIAVAKGLDHEYDQATFEKDVNMLLVGLNGYFNSNNSIDGSLNILRNHFCEVDPGREFGGMVRVSTREMSIWTTTKNASCVKQKAQILNFDDALRIHRHKSEPATN